MTSTTQSSSFLALDTKKRNRGHGLKTLHVVATRRQQQQETNDSLNVFAKPIESRMGNTILDGVKEQDKHEMTNDVSATQRKQTKESVKTPLDQEKFVAAQEHGKAEVKLDATVPAAAGFDADGHAIARVYLLTTYPPTELTSKYEKAVNGLEDERGELYWVRNALRELDEDQFSLGNLRFYQSVTAMPAGDNARETSLEAFEAMEQRKSQHRHRLQTRERHSLRNIQEYQQTIREIEFEVLFEWEKLKGR